MDYKKEIHIDADNLEMEWLIQPSNYLEAWELYADAVELRDKAKSKLDLVDSTLDEYIRLHYHKYGFDSKPSEPQIKHWITRHKKHQKAEKALIKANSLVNKMNGVKQAFSHKKDALGNIVTMKVSGYYSEPSAKDKKRLEIKRRQDISDRLDKNIRKRKKKKRS